MELNYRKIEHSWFTTTQLQVLNLTWSPSRYLGKNMARGFYTIIVTIFKEKFSEHEEESMKFYIREHKE
jgi:hypothetical protein